MVTEVISSESVTEGHPDKVCDKVSDSILDACLKEDSTSRVACETAAKGNKIFVLGEITTNAKFDPEAVVRSAIKEIGYDDTAKGLDYKSCKVNVDLTKQSPDIAQGVNEEEGDFREQGAGDQGMMYGYATNETEELMPLPIVLAHRLTSRLTEVRKSGLLPYLRPDGKSQVAIEYVNGVPKRLKNVIIAAQHDNDVDMEKLRQDIKENVIKPVCGEYLDDNTDFFINATGKFVLGGPEADAGVTGRKIIVDTYGGVGRHGGGAFSGKDPSKVDRSAAYAARYIAKNIVAAGLADKCEVQLAYVIGVAEPTSIHVNTYGTGKVPDARLVKLTREVFPLRPAAIISHFELKRPIYAETAAYGHFGRNGFPWEKTDKAEELKEKALLLKEVIAP